MNAFASSTVDTPAGPFTMLADVDGVVLAAGWTVDETRLISQIDPSLRGRLTTRADLRPAIKAVHQYLDGDLTAPAAIPVRQRTGGEFLPAVWEALRKVEPGEPVSYRELASRAGRPDAVRAAASACARNAVALFVPCHRVVRTDGRLGGFGWGLDVKRWLLAHERRVRESTSWNGQPRSADR